MAGPDLTPIQKAAQIFAAAPFRQRVCAVMSVAALEQVRVGFEKGVDPADREWPQSIRVKEGLGGGGTLVDQRRLIGSFVTEAVSADGFRIVQGMNTGFPSVRYAYVHQYGATIRTKQATYLRYRPGGWRGKTWARTKSVTIPKRAMLPEGGTLPPRWEQAMLTAANETVATALRDLGKAA